MSPERRVVVVGSGAAGLAAAVGAAANAARVTVLERTPVIGGTTAISGGVAWVPDAAAPAGSSPREAALTYLGRLAPGASNEDLVAAYVDAASRVIRTELPKHTGLELVAYPNPDYHPELPGGVTGGRSFGPADFWPEADRLGPLADRVRDAPFRMQWVNDSVADAGWWQSGRALVGQLAAGAHALGVTFRTEARAVRLLRTDGRVTGVVHTTTDGEVELAADAVVLASGGFEHHPRLSEQHIGFAFDGAMSPPWNEGDALLMASEAGADLANLDMAWWFPVYHVDGEQQDHARAFRDTNRARALPGTIIVDRSGRRFVNEARSYNIVGRAMATFDPVTATYPHREAWLVFGETLLREHGATAFARLEPDARWLVSAPTLAALAAEIGVDAAGLAATVERFDADAAAGRDTAFSRGENHYDQFQGDREQIGSPAASLAPVGAGPFHAVRLHLGTLGTKGGPRTDGRARVLDTRERPIPGLYAAGNAAASVMRASYPGGGSTIGPALTFGYLGGEDAAVSTS